MMNVAKKLPSNLIELYVASVRNVEEHSINSFYLLKRVGNVNVVGDASLQRFLSGIIETQGLKVLPSTEASWDEILTSSERRLLSVSYFVGTAIDSCICIEKQSFWLLKV